MLSRQRYFFKFDIRYVIFFNFKIMYALYIYWGVQTPFCIVSQNFATDSNVYIKLHSHTPLIFLITLIIKLPRRSHTLNITKTISLQNHKFSHKITKTATRTWHYTNSISDEHTKIALSDIRSHLQFRTIFGDKVYTVT